MYWLLLPVDANAQRHLGDEPRLPDSLWTRWWARVQRALDAVKSLGA